MYARTTASGVRSSWVTRAINSGSRLVDRLELGGPFFGLLLLAALLDDARQEIGNGTQLGNIGLGEGAPLFRLDVQHADRLVVPGERHGQHRGDEATLVDAANPEEPGIGLDVLDHDGFPRLRDTTGHALAERDAGPLDLKPVESVRRRERQVRSISIEQVERGDVGMERIPRLVDHRLEEFVPGLGRRREPCDTVEEAKLLQLLRTRDRDEIRVRHRHHDTKVRSGTGRVGCDEVRRTLRIGIDRNLRAVS